MDNSALNWRIQLIVGSVLALMAVAAVRVDLINNIEYGMTISPEMATIMALAAIGVVALPTAAAILGWSRHLKAATWICVALTVWSAVNAYTAKQGETILKAQASQENYTTAKADAKRAREVLNKISELGDVDQLGTIAAEADSQLAKDCRRKRSDACKEAEAQHKQTHERLSNAKARDAAKADLAKAEGRKQGGPAEPSMLATVIASRTGGEAADIARYIALALTGLGILVTQLVALLGGYAAELIHGALRMRPQKPRKPMKAKPEQPTGGGTKTPLPANVIRLDAARHSVEGWIDKACIIGAGEMRGGDARKSYQRWTGQKIDAGKLKDLLTDILPAGAVVQKTSGYTVVGLSLKASEKKAVSC